MSLNRFAKKRDANENALVALAEALGAEWVMAPPLDGWIFWRGVWTPTEIKNPDGKNEYTEAQIKFLIKCNLRDAPHWTWRTTDDVLKSLNARQTA